MATPLVSQPAPVWLRNLARARAMYEEHFGWPVSVQIGRRDLVLVVGAETAAIGMPARLGLHVRQELNISLLCGPIVADPGGTWWTFLTKPVGLLRADVAHDLAAVRVRVAPRGTCVELPPTLNPTARGWHWVEPPTHRALPPGSAVVATVRRLTYDAGHLAA